MLSKKTDNRLMETFKNYLIALLLAIIALLLVTQPAQSAGKSSQAKAIEYQECIRGWFSSYVTDRNSFERLLSDCSKYRP